MESARGHGRTATGSRVKNPYWSIPVAPVKTAGGFNITKRDIISNLPSHGAGREAPDGGLLLSILSLFGKKVASSLGAHRIS